MLFGRNSTSFEKVEKVMQDNSPVFKDGSESHLVNGSADSVRLNNCAVPWQYSRV